MNKAILNYLNNISDTSIVNKLLVTSFLQHKNIKQVNNTYIKNLIILEKNSDYTLLKDFDNLLNKEKQKLCFEELLEIFEFVISPMEKIVNGAIYTPEDIRNYITNQAFNRVQSSPATSLKVVDISCGCGGFLIAASEEIREKTKKSYKKIFEENIYGVDIQKYSVDRTKILLSLLAIAKGEDEKEFKFNIHIGDTLEYDWKDTRFDMILGNPPYVCSRNMDDKTKSLMKNWEVCKTGHPDLYIPFFQIGYELLKENGILGYITVNSFINSVNGRAIREYFEDKKAFMQIIDFKDEQIFKDRMTYTCICFIQPNKKDEVWYTSLQKKNLKDIDKIKFIKEKYNNLDSFQGWSLRNNNFVIDIESRGTPFGEIYDTKSGIATLKNHVYIFKPFDEDEQFYYLDKDTPIEKSICKNIINSNKLAKYDEFEKLIEKIIFPYTHDKDGKPVVIEEETLKSNYPKTYKYLLSNKELLSTRDKGKGKYSVWYAFGRNQSLEKRKHKLFFPQLVREGFKTYYSEDENLYFYNGMCAYASKKDLKKLQKVMKIYEFWKYIENKAKHYVSGYFGLGRNSLKNYGILEEIRKADITYNHAKKIM